MNDSFSLAVEESQVMSVPASTPTADRPLILPEDVLYEVVNGQYVEVPSMGAFETTLASTLHFLMEGYARAQNLGRCVVETLFLLDAASNLKRRPDVAFVSYERWPKG